MNQNDKKHLEQIFSKDERLKNISFNYFLKEYEWIIPTVMKKLNLNGLTKEDKEDLEQEAMLKFYLSLISYDELYGTKLSTFIYSAISFHMKNNLKKIRRIKDTKDIENLNESKYNYTDEQFDIIEYNDLLVFLKEKLKYLEYVIMEGKFIKDKKINELAEDLEISESTVKRKINEVRENLIILLEELREEI